MMRRGVGVVSSLAVSVACLAGCGDDADTTPEGGSYIVQRVSSDGVKRLDVLLVVDNSISMGDKQAALASVVPDVLGHFALPPCVDDEGQATGDVATGGVCPDGQRPMFAPVDDINIGLISSSLGAVGADACNQSPEGDDRGHLLARGAGGPADTFQGLGFLAWDPANTRGGETDLAALADSVRDLVVGAGEAGCGYEMPLEAMVRFLVDPEPYATLTIENNMSVESGVDEVLLQQRRDFLRPDSALLVISLSDENDCSTAPRQGFLVLEPEPFFRATSECAVDPADECCTSCGLPQEECPTDPACTAQPSYTQEEDPPNLACWNQKQRYGVSFLYPVARYTNAFTLAQIDSNATDLSPLSSAADNPIFSDLSGDGSGVRDPGLVFFAPIVGVPWQAIARRDGGGQPDASLGFMTPDELASNGSFEALVGDPDSYVPPTDPFMIESVEPRSGTSEPVGASLPGANPINGGDVDGLVAELQRSCVFDLATPIPDSILCEAAAAGDPLCDGTTQVAAATYPGLRQLALARSLGSQGIVASACPAQFDNPASPDWGYRPSAKAITDRVSEAFRPRCYDDSHAADAGGRIACIVVEARVSGGDCSCSAPGREALEGSEQGAAADILEDEFSNPAWDCFCEITQLEGDDLAACQNEAGQGSADGFCYIDATVDPPVGNPALVSACSAGEERLLRFVGEGDPQPGASVYVACASPP